MNRQLRRATEKSDKKRDKERDKRRGARKTPSQSRSQPNKSQQLNTSDKRESTEQQSKKATRQQRWAGIYVVMTIVVIAFQAVLPEQDMDTLSLVIHGLFYLTFGYFLVSWLLRQRIPQAFVISTVTGGLLAVGVELVKFYRPEVTADPLLIYIALPSLLLGALLGRFVYLRTG